MWTLHLKPSVEKDLHKLDPYIQKRILNYLYKNVLANPKKIGKALTGNLAGFWRYRVNDYRIICEIKNHELTILVVEIGHRSKVYDK